MVSRLAVFVRSFLITVSFVQVKISGSTPVFTTSCKIRAIACNNSSSSWSPIWRGIAVQPVAFSLITLYTISLTSSACTSNYVYVRVGSVSLRFVSSKCFEKCSPIKRSIFSLSTITVSLSEGSSKALTDKSTPYKSRRLPVIRKNVLTSVRFAYSRNSKSYWYRFLPSFFILRSLSLRSFSSSSANSIA